MMSQDSRDRTGWARAPHEGVRWSVCTHSNKKMHVRLRKDFWRGHFDAQVSEIFTWRNKYVQENEYYKCLRTCPKEVIFVFSSSYLLFIRGENLIRWIVTLLQMMNIVLSCHVIILTWFRQYGTCLDNTLHTLACSWQYITYLDMSDMLD